MSEPTLVFRVVSRDELGGHLRDHIVGVTRPATAIAREGWPRVETLIGADPEAPYAVVSPGLSERAERDALGEGKAALAAAEMPQRGRRPKPLLDMIVAGAPTFERSDRSDPEPWSVERVRRFALRALAAVRRGLGPRSVITAAAWHGDERSPHLHIQAVPIASDGRLGWSHVRAEWAQRAGLAPPEAEPPGKYTRRVKRDGKWVKEPRAPLNAAEVARSRERRSAEMSTVQDFMHERVGVRYGLARGERGSHRRHQAVNRTLAVEGRAKAVAAEVERAEAWAQTVQERAELWDAKARESFDAHERAKENTRNQEAREAAARERLAEIQRRAEWAKERDRQAKARVEVAVELEKDLEEERSSHEEWVLGLKNQAAGLQKVRKQLEEQCKALLQEHERVEKRYNALRREQRRLAREGTAEARESVAKQLVRARARAKALREEADELESRANELDACERAVDRREEKLSEEVRSAFVEGQRVGRGVLELDQAPTVIRFRSDREKRLDSFEARQERLSRRERAEDDGPGL